MKVAIALLALLALGCGSPASSQSPISPRIGLPIEIEGNVVVPLEKVRQAIATGDMSDEKAIAKSVVALYYAARFLEVRLRTEREDKRILVRIDEGRRFSEDEVRKMRGEQVQAQPAGKDGLRCEPTPGIGKGEALVLRRDQSVTLGVGRYHFSRICVRDYARIQVCARAEIFLSGIQTTVIGGRGIGGFGNRQARIKIFSRTAAGIFVYFDNLRARVHASVVAPAAQKIGYAQAGPMGLSLGQALGGARHPKSHTNLGRGNKQNFPVCN